MGSKQNTELNLGVRILRLFQKLIIDGKKHFLSDLAQEFECSPQTIMRMMLDIEHIMGDRLEQGLESRRKWYRIKTASYKHLGLDFEELRYLSLCRDLASGILPDQVMERIDSTLFNLSVLMCEHDFARRHLATKKCFHFYPKGKIDYSPHHETIKKLIHAAENQLVCIIEYKSSGSSKSKEHYFLPTTITSMNNALYALGVGLHKDLSTIRHHTSLAIHRIQDIVVTTKRAQVPTCDFGETTFGLPWHEPRTFRIRFTPGKASDYVRERIWADNQRIEEHEDGSITLEITTRSEPELMAWVRSFGKEASLEDRQASKS